MAVVESELVGIAVDGDIVCLRLGRCQRVADEELGRVLEHVGAGVWELLATGMALLLDLADGPSVVGPSTTMVLGRLLGRCEAERVPVALLCQATPLGRLQGQRMALDFAPTAGSTHADEGEAKRMLSSRERRRDIRRAPPTTPAGLAALGTELDAFRDAGRSGTGRDPFRDPARTSTRDAFRDPARTSTVREPLRRPSGTMPAVSLPPATPTKPPDKPKR